MPYTSILTPLNWNEVESHYLQRVKESKNLLTYYEDGKVLQRDNREQAVERFSKLALGIDVGAGNYSAKEHPVLQGGILANHHAHRRVYELAGNFIPLKDASRVPKLITDAQIKYLQISVGSEISCMVNPTVCWVCNVRTIWTHLAWTDGPGRAEQLLKLYRSNDQDSGMAYLNWADVYHPLLRESLIQVAEEGRKLAKIENITPGDEVFLWADAIASYAYGEAHGE
jgi:hypothetical protein